MTRNTRRRRQQRRQRLAELRPDPVVVERAVTWLHVFQGFGTRVYPWQPGLICGLLYGGIVVEGRSPDELAVNVQCVLIEITKRQKRS